MELKVSINHADVLFDVLNITHRAGLALEANDGNRYRAAAHVIVSLDPSDKLSVQRSISNAAKRIRTEFGEYLKEVTIPENTVTNLLKQGELDLDNGAIEYKFEMPSNFNSSAMDAMAAGIHDYIVASTIADWYMTANPEAVPAYQAQMAAALENARRALYKRSRPSRPSYIVDMDS